MRVNGTLVEDKMGRFKGECAHFRFNKWSIYTHDGANAKFSTNPHEKDYSAPHPRTPAAAMGPLHRLNNKYGSPKLMWSPCAQLYSMDETPHRNPPPPPLVGS